MISLVILQKFVFPLIRDINITFLAIAKISPHKVIKISTSAKMNPREIWENFSPQK